MSLQLIVASHAELAKGMLNTFHFLTGMENMDNIHAICAYTEDAYPEICIEQMLSTYCKDENSDVIVLTDLKGGSINQIFCRMLQKYSFHLISGMNLALLLELALYPQDHIAKEELRKMMKNAKEDLSLMNEELTAFAAEAEEADFLEE